MQKIALVISYIGTGFCGWQKQSGASSGKLKSVQEAIEQALQKITQESPSVVASGRTDAGVHAMGQVVHFTLHSKKWDPEILALGLHSQLPASIRVLKAKEVAPDFHSQRGAIKKQYTYYFQQGPCAIPVLEPYSFWIRKELNISAMKKALAFLVGEHDFKPFQSSGGKPMPTVRKIFKAQIVRIEPHFPQFITPSVEGVHLVGIRLIGSGFLKQMVRGIAGTLLQVGENRRPESDVGKILKSMDRAQVGPTAPARALWLERVWYTGLNL